MIHEFVIPEATCYWHHEFEYCGACGKVDKPDDPELPIHTRHSEAANDERMQRHSPDRWVQGEHR